MPLKFKGQEYSQRTSYSYDDSGKYRSEEYFSNSIVLSGSELDEHVSYENDLKYRYPKLGFQFRTVRNEKKTPRSVLGYSESTIVRMASSRFEQYAPYSHTKIEGIKFDQISGVKRLTLNMKYHEMWVTYRLRIPDKHGDKILKKVKRSESNTLETGRDLKKMFSTFDLGDVDRVRIEEGSIVLVVKVLISAINLFAAAITIGLFMQSRLERENGLK